MYFAQNGLSKFVGEVKFGRNTQVLWMSIGFWSEVSRHLKPGLVPNQRYWLWWWNLWVYWWNSLLEINVTWIWYPGMISMPPSIHNSGCIHDILMKFVLLKVINSLAFHQQTCNRLLQKNSCKLHGKFCQGNDLVTKTGHLTFSAVVYLHVLMRYPADSQFIE